MNVAYAGGTNSAQPGPRARQRNVAHVEVPAANRESAAQRAALLIQNFLPGKRLKVTVEVDHPTRSSLQNKALWGCAYKALEEQTGNDPEDLHVFWCGEWFGWETYEVMGSPRKRPVRTTTTNEHGERDVIDKMVMAEFYDFIQKRSAVAGFDVPDPDPLWFDKPQRTAA